MLCVETALNVRININKLNATLNNNILTINHGKKTLEYKIKDYKPVTTNGFTGSTLFTVLAEGNYEAANEIIKNKDLMRKANVIAAIQGETTDYTESPIGDNNTMAAYASEYQNQIAYIFKRGTDYIQAITTPIDKQNDKIMILKKSDGTFAQLVKTTEQKIN